MDVTYQFLSIASVILAAISPIFIRKLWPAIGVYFVVIFVSLYTLLQQEGGGEESATFELTVLIIFGFPVLIMVSSILFLISLYIGLIVLPKKKENDNMP
jgi:hypothetical protein